MDVETEPLALPPGPDLPARQLAKLWIEQPIELWESCAAAHGETFTVELGTLGTTVLFSNPEAVRQVFQLPPGSFECRQYNEHYKYVMGGRSVLLTDGPEHLRKRKLLMPTLHRRLVEQHGAALVRLAREAVDGWPRDRAFSPRPAMHLVSLKIILRLFFGSVDDGLGRALTEIFAREIYQDLTAWGPWTRFGHLQPEIRPWIDEEVRRRRSQPGAGGTSLLDALIQARDEDGAWLDDAEIQDHLFTMLTGGADPTALALAWLLYWIHEEPAALARVRRELAELGPDPDPVALVRLPYLDAVCQESLRMYPVVTTPTGRKLLAEVTIQGRRYAPGVTLLPCTYLVHRRADLYPEPSRFRPERFLGRSFAAHEYFPFGGGARTCIGASLAPLEMKLILAEVLNRGQLVPAHDGPVHPVRHGTLLAPSDALKFMMVGSPPLAEAWQRDPTPRRPDVA